MLDACVVLWFVPLFENFELSSTLSHLEEDCGIASFLVSPAEVFFLIACSAGSALRLFVELLSSTTLVAALFTAAVQRITLISPHQSLFPFSSLWQPVSRLSRSFINSFSPSPPRAGMRR
jgi:hypothetical protein